MAGLNESTYAVEAVPLGGEAFLESFFTFIAEYTVGYAAFPAENPNILSNCRSNSWPQAEKPNLVGRNMGLCGAQGRSPNTPPKIYWKVELFWKLSCFGSEAV